VVERPCTFAYADAEIEDWRWVCSPLPGNSKKTAIDGVWELAEKTARAAGVDQVRVDIFVDREHSTAAPVVNEIRYTFLPAHL